MKNVLFILTITFVLVSCKIQTFSQKNLCGKYFYSNRCDEDLMTYSLSLANNGTFTIQKIEDYGEGPIERVHHGSWKIEDKKYLTLFIDHPDTSTKPKVMKYGDEDWRFPSELLMMIVDKDSIKYEDIYLNRTENCTGNSYLKTKTTKQKSKAVKKEDICGTFFFTDSVKPFPILYKLVLCPDGSFTFQDMKAKGIGRWEILDKKYISLVCDKPDMYDILRSNYMGAREYLMIIVDKDHIKKDGFLLQRTQ